MVATERRIHHAPHEQFMKPESIRYLFGTIRGLLGASERRGNIFVASPALVVAKGVKIDGKQYPSIADIFVAPPIGTIISDPEALTAFISTSVPHMRPTQIERASLYQGDGFTLPRVAFANGEQRINVIGVPAAGPAQEIASYLHAQRDFKVEPEEVRDFLSLGITGEQLVQLKEGTLMLPELRKLQSS